MPPEIVLPPTPKELWAALGLDGQIVRFVKEPAPQKEERAAWNALVTASIPTAPAFVGRLAVIRTGYITPSGAMLLVRPISSEKEKALEVDAACVEIVEMGERARLLLTSLAPAWERPKDEAKSPSVFEEMDRGFLGNHLEKQRTKAEAERLQVVEEHRVRCRAAAAEDLLKDTLRKDVTG